MTNSAPLLRVRDLCVTFPSRRGRPPVCAVDRVSFDIAPGQTLGRELNAMPRGELRAMRRHMQFVLQNPYSSLHPRMNVAQILAEPLNVHRSVPKPRIAERVAELMTLVGMDPAVVKRYPHEFSGGQRQRIVIARALAVNPDFVVCDEPVSALDVRTQAQIVDLLHDLQDKLRLSYLFIAHDLAVVRAVAHRVAVMYGGRIVELGDAPHVYDSPAHPYTRNLLDAVPIPDPARQRAKLAASAPEPQFRGRDGETGACIFGEDHAASGTPEWHEVGPSHGVSCRFWPPGVASLPAFEI